jgi:DNA-binding GntR family transcriptional regulator
VSAAAVKGRDTLVARAHGKIKRRILSNALRPDQRVLEQDLAAAFGMSRTPVREALIRLEQEGLVEILPRRGMRVLPISAADMAEIYELLTALEARAAERLAERKPTPESVAPLTRALERMEAALEAGNLKAWARADDRFHRQLVTLAGNRRLAEMARTVFDQAHRARMATLDLRPWPRQSNKDHRALVRAILKGDARRAREIHTRHRHRAMAMLLALLERHDLREL